MKVSYFSHAHIVVFEQEQKEEIRARDENFMGPFHMPFSRKHFEPEYCDINFTCIREIRNLPSRE